MAESGAFRAGACAEDERDYVLGTGDVEVERLGAQHAAWRPIALDCWRRAGIKEGYDVLDVGAGPGHAAFDLAELVGPAGSVTAVERSRRFIEAGTREAVRRRQGSVRFMERDLVIDPLPDGPFDAAWCRWVCSFIGSPESLIEKLSTVLKPEGVAVFHEYVAYASWRFSPPRPLLEHYIARVMESWREEGGEPDIAAALPPLLRKHGFEVVSAEPRVYVVGPGHPLWSGWISPFVRTNLGRLQELGRAEAEWRSAVLEEFLAAEDDPGSLMMTPAVLEIVARRAV